MLLALAVCAALAPPLARLLAGEVRMLVALRPGERERSYDLLRPCGALVPCLGNFRR